MFTVINVLVTISVVAVFWFFVLPNIRKGLGKGGGILRKFGLGKKSSAEALFSKAAYRNDEQKRAVHYFSGANKKGCFARLRDFLSPTIYEKDPTVKKGCFTKKLGFISDAEYDALVQSAVSKMDPENRGLAKIGLDKSQIEKTISFGNYVFDELGDNKWCEDDDRLRTTKFEVTYLFFTQNQIAVYQLALSSEWEQHEEVTYEYHYKDITSFKSETKQQDVVITVDKGKKGCCKVFGPEKIYRTTLNEFVITVPGDSFSVRLGSKTTVEEEQSIQAMKAMIREKKA